MVDLVLHVTSALQIQQKPLLVPGQPTHLQKHSLAQYQVDKGSARRLSWWIASRCHKATHIYKHDAEQLSEAYTDAVHYALQHGYPLKVIRHALSRLRHLPGMSATLRACRPPALRAW